SPKSRELLGHVLDVGAVVAHEHDQHRRVRAGLGERDRRARTAGELSGREKRGARVPSATIVEGVSAMVASMTPMLKTSSRRARDELETSSRRARDEFRMS